MPTAAPHEATLLVLLACLKSDAATKIEVTEPPIKFYFVFFSFRHLSLFTRMHELLALSHDVHTRHHINMVPFITCGWDCPSAVLFESQCTITMPCVLVHMSQMVGELVHVAKQVENNVDLLWIINVMHTVIFRALNSFRQLQDVSITSHWLDQ